ncbi:MAG: flagellar basal-body MS-ring/collar protein FliF [Spirochaetales bacterium]|nr:flagellar basal-body MS-ring/collar protein FliF [Spirochaetales bacterium]
MNEWFKKVIERVKTAWGKWSGIQKIIFFAIIAAVIAGIVVISTVSSSPGEVALFTTPISDQDLLYKISMRLDEESVEHKVTEDGMIYVNDKASANRMVSILMREDLIPSDISPWDVFKMDRWTVTDFEREVNLQRAVTEGLEDHIEALDDVDDAKVTLVMPETELFTEDQDPVTASVIITPKPGSDITTSRKKIEGIEKLVLFAVQGLKTENIVITDYRGTILNDFEDMAEFDRLELTKRQMDQKAKLERKYKAEILNELKGVFGSDRVRVFRVDVDLDMGKKTVETDEYFPITIKPDNPDTPYDDSEVIKNVPRSEQIVDESYKGTGFNPEGPPGQEGQTPPAYKDLEGLVGDYNNKSNTINYEVNERKIHEEKNPWEIKRITVAVAVDGVWTRVYNDKGLLSITPEGTIERKYTDVDNSALEKARILVEHSIGYNATRGDSVSVEHLKFDRTEQFEKEDEKYRNQKRLQQALLYSIIGVAIIILAFIVFRLISRELERRRRLREEELARQHQAMREAALRSAEEESVDVEMSVEERARMEMQEHAMNMAREHPEDVAQLIRTWLAEE